MEKETKRPVAALCGYAVALALGYQLTPFDLDRRVMSNQPGGYQFAIGFIPRDEAAMRQSILMPWPPCDNWVLSGPIIEKVSIGIFPSVTFGEPGPEASSGHSRQLDPAEGPNM